MNVEGEIDIGETIKTNIDYWRKLYFKEQEQNKMLINEKNIYKDLTRQAQEDVKIWKDLYEKEKEKNKRLEKFIENGEYTWKQKYNETFDYIKKEE